MKQRIASVGMVLAMAGCMTIGSAAVATPAFCAEKTASSTAKKTDAPKVAKYVGSSESKKYHKPSCIWVKKINKENRVEFASKAEAEKAGYEPCKVCLASPKKTADSAATSASTAAKKIKDATQ